MKNSISYLEIENFKSIKELKIDCKRVNVFIGKPNTGKSNILEALSLFCFPYYRDGLSLNDYVRAENMTHLFYELEIEKKITINCNQKNVTVEYKAGEDKYDFNLTEYDTFLENGMPASGVSYTLKFDNNFSSSIPGMGSTRFKFYRFKVFPQFKLTKENYLLPPYGENLEGVLLTHKKLSEYLGRLINQHGKRLAIRSHEHRIEEQKDKGEFVIAPLPYILFSDGIKRLMFNLAAIETNVNSIIMLEEPESHYFPFYTNYFAERISQNNINQLFLTTHNPYFLSTIIAKTNLEELNIFVVYFKNYETKVKKLTKNDIKEIIEYDIDAFNNLERFIE